MSSGIFWGFFVSLLVVITSPPCNIEAFNVEMKHYAIYRQESKSMFGFAVSTYRDKYGRGWAIVGAPEAQTNQVKVYRGGAVYRCDIAVDDRCDIIHFDDIGNNYVINPAAGGNILSQIDNKTLQWFGASVSASNVDGGPILACAPRYIWFSRSQQKPEDNKWSKEITFGNRRDPVGTCWAVLKNFNESAEFSPCRTRYWGYHRQGSCQAGLGAAMSKDGERVFIGAPGSWYWQGQLYSIWSAMRFRFVTTATPDEIPGQTFSQPLNNRNKVMFTKEAPASEDDSYMGYSVATGDFVGNGDSGTAVGVPRGFGLRGKVVLLTSNMTNHQNITGEQMGAYFGYSIATGDIDGDGLDDLIIGAPMYTIPDNPEMTIETGRIYIIYQGRSIEKFRKFDIRDGESNRGRFGLSLASLGDIDRDNYGDFVVGAPYGGPEGRGAVYIFYGSRNGVLEKYSQAIYAESLAVPVSTFGFSVAGGLDLDGNQYNDVVIGAYESSAAFFFRARPVIKMSSFVLFETDQSGSKLISLNNKNCTLSDGSRVTCIPLKGCLQYTGDGVQTKYTFNVQYVADVKKTKTPRLFFLEQENKNMINKTITLEKDSQHCRTVQVYVTPNIRDKLTSLEAELRISLVESYLIDNHPRDPRRPLTPVIGATTSKKDALSIRKNCGPDNVCIPDLQLTVKPNVNRYLLGSEKKLEMEILVLNNGEDAFEATFNVQLPSGINYIKIEKLDKSEVPVLCSAPKQSNNNTLRCDIGNPLPQKKSVHFNVLLQPVPSNSMTPTYEFHMEVNTTNVENSTTTNDNTWHFSLPIWVETELRVEGESRPKEIRYDPANYTETNVTTESDFGKAVIHDYIIFNHGPSEILEAEAFLIWPAQTLAGDELLYLMEQPITTGPITCENANYNYLNLKLDPRKKGTQIHNYPDPSGLFVDESHSGKTVNVQSGFDMSPLNKSSHKDEAELNSGDSSNVQKSRHSSSSSSTSVTSSETKRIQLSSNNQGPNVVTTTYNQNTSTITSTSGVGNAGIFDDNIRINVHTDSSGHTGSIEPGIQSNIHENHFGSDLTNLDTSHRIQSNDWRESSNVDEEIPFGITTISEDETELARKYQEERRHNLKNWKNEEELRMKKLEEERRIEEERRQREREEEDRIYREKQQLEYERLIQERREEAERRQLEERRWEEEQRRVEERRREQTGDTEYDYDDRRGRIDTGSTDNYNTRNIGTIAGGTDSVINREGEFILKNFSSTQELEKVLGSLSKDATGYHLYTRQGRQYVQFMGRFRTLSGRREYIEFQDGSMFPLLDSRGVQSYETESIEPPNNRYLRMEGQLMIGQDGRGFIVLKDGRRFSLQGSYTYTEERTYTFDGPGSSTSKSHSWQKGSFESSGSARKDYQSGYGSSRVEEFGKNDRFLSEPDPNLIKSRLRRESDTMEVAEFRKFEERKRKEAERHRREIADSSVTDENSSTYQRKFLGVSEVPLCETAKCVQLRCVIKPLKKDEEITISVRYLVNVRTINKVAYNEQLDVSSKLVAQVTKQPFIGTPSEKVEKSHEIITNVKADVAASPPYVVPLWIVVLSACAGVIILLLLIYLLHKCGFFKRNRPSDAPERQPLNRNGHFQQGEEHP